jgi:hypothetical protein
VSQTPFDQLVSEIIRVLSNGGTGYKAILKRPVGLYLLSDVLVENQQPFICHILSTHGQLLKNLLTCPCAEISAGQFDFLCTRHDDRRASSI